MPQKCNSLANGQKEAVKSVYFWANMLLYMLYISYSEESKFNLRGCDDKLKIEHKANTIQHDGDSVIVWESWSMNGGGNKYGPVCLFGHSEQQFEQICNRVKSQWRLIFSTGQ